MKIYLLRFVLIVTCVNSRQARNTHRSDHWSAPLFMFLLPAENSCMCMRNKIKTNRDKSSIEWSRPFGLVAQIYSK